MQYRLRVVLCDIEPAIWRTLEVPSSIELPYLHDVLQIVMGWEDYHLHKFVLGDEPWAHDAVSFVMQSSLDEGFDDLPSVNHLELDVRLEELLTEPGESIIYLYDFGDDWAHQLTLEAIVGDDISGASCPDGARACPPEDCGGPHGYADLLAVLADTGHPEHQHMTAWAGPFDPEHFDRDAINQTLTARTRNGETLRSAAAASALVADLITRVTPPALPALADVLSRADLNQTADVDDATATAAMAKIIWMVHHIGDRLKLTGWGPSTSGDHRSDAS
ncbi:pRiA4b ORF-3-like protein [Williamsia limnetica]|uniref:PRiA4b ORF-3-like protein n=1 Tax=Williamsia limnetica TaxID=882452 RepID=A0A318RE02_WILLI|nr:pRiA4b ORF-3-like protein [Williamsia limnetica]